MIDELRAAAEALNEGDPAPFAALMAEDSEWRGVSSGHLWWKRAAACHGPKEALEVMQFQIRKRGDRRMEISEPSFAQIGDDTIIGSAEWTGTDGRRQVRYQVISFRDGKIVDMQGCGSRREAERFARRRSRR
jgi:ketosteroid isomerase-like protein